MDPRERFKKEEKYVVEPDAIIADVIHAFPRAAGVFMSYGLHCVGCAASAFDTVEGGAKLHGMPDEEISQMIADTNAAINKKIETLEFTERALAKIKEIQVEEKKAGLPLRITVTSTEGKFTYDMDFKEQEEGDHEFEFGGVPVIVDAKSYPLLKGSSIDFIDSLMGQGFKIENPNMFEKTC